ncbi:hypothetical protein ACMFMF_007462 [Clarireedia jacksonii]
MAYYQDTYDDYAGEKHDEYQPARAGWSRNQDGGQADPYQQPPRGSSLNKNNMNGYQQNSSLGATFYPGGGDDFYMPTNVVSPMPHRVMPEVPSNMQDSLANLELNSDGHRVSSYSTASSMQSPYDNYHGQHTRESSRSSVSRYSGPGFTASYDHTNASIYQNLKAPQGTPRFQPDSPRFSPFPKPRDAGPNVPLSDDDKEEVLERARPLVLKSTDPEMQLAWAQDALTWVEVASQSYERRQEQKENPGNRVPTPKIEHQLRVDAISIVNFLAEQQHPKAEFMKAMWLEFGKFGYRQDLKESFQCYQRAAKKGYARAEYRIGMQYENTQNPAKAVEHYTRGVQMRDSAANYRLGMATLLGQCGIQQDYQRGIDLIQFAADTADENAPQGAYVYGMLLARELPNITMPEEYLPYDLNDAKLFIEKAAYLGFAKAQLKMAQAYELCLLGCEFDPALSLHYNALAARQGEAEADMAISKWFLCGYEGVFDKNEKLAYTYAQRAAETEMATAEFAMGYFYEIGMYVSKDLQKAQEWYNKAARHGNQDALGRIDSIKRNNVLSKSEHEAVALNRIRSTHGSRRGGKPPRFQNSTAPPMPAMAEDPSGGQPAQNRQAPRKKGAPAGIRPISIAPYPEDDISPGNRGNNKVSPNYPPRSPRYPQDQLRPSTASSNPASDRPSSAFGIRTQQAPQMGIHHQNTEPIRASASMSNMSSQSIGNPRDRIPSDGGRQPQIPGKNRDPSPSGAPYIPPLNFGSPSTANRPNTSSSSRPGTAQSYASRPVQTPNSAPPPRGSSMTPATPGSAPASATAGRGPNRTPMNTMTSQTPDSRQSSVSSAPTTPAPGKPKKQGPATFEEMGIPKTKDENECLVM